MLNYDCFPTFYSSKVAISRSTSALFEIPTDKSQLLDERKRVFENTIAKLISNNANTSWVFFMPDYNSETLASPLRALVSNPTSFMDSKNSLLEVLPKSCKFIDLHHSDYKEYAKDYFKTDHHLQMQGAVRLYRETMGAFGRESLDFNNYFSVFENRFYGSLARKGLCDYNADTIYDVSYGPSNISVFTKGKNHGLDILDKAWLNNGKKYNIRDKYRNLYDYWFHGNFPGIRIQNNDLPEGAGALLIISDSYGNNFERLFAESYKYVYKIDPRYYDSNIDEFVKIHQY